MKTLTREQIIEVLKPFIEFANERLDESDNTPDSHIVYQYDKKVITIGDLRRLEILASELSGQEDKINDEFHVWVIPVKKEIFVEDRGGGIPVGATEHIVFDTWEGAFKLGQFLSKFCNYNLELDNDAGRFAEDSFFKSRLQDHITGQKDDSIAKTETDTGKIVDMPELVSKQDHAKAMRDDKILKSK